MGPRSLSLAQGRLITTLSPLQITQLKIASNPFAKGFRETDSDSWYCVGPGSSTLEGTALTQPLAPILIPRASPKASPQTFSEGRAH